MTLLEHYLKSVRLYLPQGRAKDDILNELAEHLQSTMETREDTLGRPLTEAEQEAILTKHGNPMVVAGRYGAKQRSVAFGWQLIGPELFPLYVRVLALNWALAGIVRFIVSRFVPLTVAGLLWNFVAQFIVVTTIFTCVDFLQRRSKGARSWIHEGYSEDYNWRFPPSYLQPVPRWQSLCGGLFLFAVLVWWTLLPFAPRLLIGKAAAIVEFSPSAQWLYAPVLLLLLAGAVQRAYTLVHPTANLTQAITRLVTNLVAVVLVYPYALSHPVLIAKASASHDLATMTALRISNSLWWVIVSGFSVYWLVNAGFHLWLCVQHLRHASRRRTSHLS